MRGWLWRFDDKSASGAALRESLDASEPRLTRILVTPIRARSGQGVPNPEPEEHPNEDHRHGRKHEENERGTPTRAVEIRRMRKSDGPGNQCEQRRRPADDESEREVQGKSNRGHVLPLEEITAIPEA